MEHIVSFFGCLIRFIFLLIWSVIKFIGTAIAVFIAFIMAIIIYKRIKGKKWHRTMSARSGEFTGPIDLQNEKFADLQVDGDAYLSEVVVTGLTKINGNLRADGNNQLNKLIVYGKFQAEDSFFNDIEVVTESSIIIKNCPFNILTVKSERPIIVELTGDTGTNIIFEGAHGEIVYVATMKD
jgi:hypothetical protein